MVSPWWSGLLALGSLAALAIAVPDTTTALELWLLLVIVIILLTRAGRRRSASTPAEKPPKGQGETPPPLPGPPTASPAVGATDLIGVPAPAAVVMTSDEAAALLRVDHALVVNAIVVGDLPGNHIGDQWRLPSQAVMTWLYGSYTAKRRSRKRPPPPEGKA